MEVGSFFVSCHAIGQRVICGTVEHSKNISIRLRVPGNEIQLTVHMRYKVKRCMERAAADEKLTEKELIRKMRQIDKARSQTRELMGGSDWGRRESYHLTVNTTHWEIKELVPAVADFADRWFGRKK